MSNVREQLIQAIQNGFDPSEREAVLAALDLYGIASHERERERVQLAILTLAAGDKDALARLVQVAKTDYRDILAWHEQGPLSPVEGSRAQQAARNLIKRWGRP